MKTSKDFIVQIGKYEFWDFHSEQAFMQCVQDRAEGLFLSPKRYGASLIVDKHPMITEYNKYTEQQNKKLKVERGKKEKLDLT